MAANNKTRGLGRHGGASVGKSAAGTVYSAPEFQTLSAAQPVKKPEKPTRNSKKPYIFKAENLFMTDS